MKRIFALLLITATTNAFAQDCSCRSQFAFVKDYYEKNNPAFQKIKADNKDYKAYTVELDKLTREIGKESNNDRCNIYFEKYVSLLKDHHSGIDLNLKRQPLDLSNQKAIDSFKSTVAYKSFKKVKIDTTALLRTMRSKPSDDIEGLYTSGSISIAIVKGEGKGQYQGIVTRQNKLLDVGHVLLDLSKTGDRIYQCIYHTGLMGLNFQNIYKAVELREGRIPEIGFTKIGIEDIEGRKPYSFKLLDDSTGYLQLLSFDKKYKNELDSFYKTLDLVIQSKPNLIIDLRDNGGGAEDCYLNLVKYIYTRPLVVDEIQVWNSPDNIRRYEEVQYNLPLVARMKEAKSYEFMEQVVKAPDTWKMTGTEYPKKLVVLFNRHTASSAEGMITYAIQSEKVITMGENSGGFIGYGDVMTATIPCGKYSLRSTTTKYFNNSKYEFVGIPPMVNLKGKKDWIGEARKVLKNYSLR
jgi:hypothetical protein